MEHPDPAVASGIGTGRHSVLRLPRAWFVACPSKELRQRPIARTIQGTAIVLYRGGGGAPSALLDRCAHRNVPLSLGTCVEAGAIQCAYHGWRFDGTGACLAVPGRMVEDEIAGSRSRRVPMFACVEQDGFVWVYSTPDEKPAGPPPRFPHLDDSRYGVIRRSFRIEGPMHAAIENALDVPHTAFLHRSLHRSGKTPHEIDVTVRRSHDRVEAEFTGEPRPEGLAGRLLAPGGGIVAHFDRFLLPSIAQVEYRIGDAAHVVLTAAHTPATDLVTDVHAIGVFRLRVPHWLVRLFGIPVAKKILRQDQDVLHAQAETVRRFGGENFASTELDVLGRDIWRLLERASRGETVPEDGAAGGPAAERRFKIQV
jgi:phenylpropionate dioxygenase-like ring-hydroxylating dioxygenase large terminal subunit